MITTLKTMFPGYSIAFSDHSPGWEMDIAAVALGADMVEKTITLDRTIKSCEHSFSLESADAKRFVKSIRELETALGSTRRVIPSSEKKKRKIARRSPYALKHLKAGAIIRADDFEFKRPGFGITSEEFEFFKGKKLIRDIKSGEGLTFEHI
jgi:sialic acid synthase SpsE